MFILNFRKEAISVKKPFVLEVVSGFNSYKICGVL